MGRWCRGLAFAGVASGARLASVAVSSPAKESQRGPAEPALEEVGVAYATAREFSPDGVSARPRDGVLWTPAQIVVNDAGEVHPGGVDEALGNVGN